MAPIPGSDKPKLGNVLVIGGCGFLGHHIVNLLLSSYTAQVSVLDLRTTRNRRPDEDNVQYFDGDITSLNSILPIFQKTKPDVVIHTASPTLVGGSKEMYKKVNVDGTATVIEACQKTGVKALVYTSSASVISDNQSDLINADERWPIIPASKQTEYYSQTKVGFSSLFPSPPLTSYRRYSSASKFSTMFEHTNKLQGRSRNSGPRRKPLSVSSKPPNRLPPSCRHLWRRRCPTPPSNDQRLHHRKNWLSTR